MTGLATETGFREHKDYHYEVELGTVRLHTIGRDVGMLTAWAIVQTQKNHRQEICAAMLPEIIGPMNVPMKYAQLRLGQYIISFLELGKLTNITPSRHLSDAKTSHQKSPSA